MCDITLPFSSDVNCGTSVERLVNVTQTIYKLLEGYDIRLRPNFGGEWGALLFELRHNHIFNIAVTLEPRRLPY